MKHFVRHAPLILLVILAVSLRLYRVTNPPLDWHAHRQADTAAVTRSFVQDEFAPLRPKYDDISDIQSGFNNPEGYRMVEFPLLNAIVAGVVLAVPSLQLELVHRILSILLSAGTLITLFFLVHTLSGPKLAYATAFVFAVLPYSVYYGRTILPEPGMLFFLVLSIFAFTKWLIQKHWGWYLTAGVSLALAALLKPFVLFFGPVYLALLWKYRELLSKPRVLFAVLLGLASLVPFAGWRWWITQFPEGVPVSGWLFNGNGIRFRPAWVRWLGYERITKLMLGFVGVIFLALSLLRKSRSKLVYFAWWASVAVYFTVIATGNVQHDYYQVLAIPILSISIAEGTLFAFDKLRKSLLPLLNTILGEKRAHEAAAEILSLSIVAAGFCSMLVLSWIQVRGYFNVNHWEYQKAGQAVQALTPPDALVIAPAFGDTQFLYQTNRKGWPLGFSIDDKIALGATHYVTTSYDDEARELEARFFVVEKTDEYLIIDLTRPKNE